jgi:GntR family transcriptional regulator / MocR family aminotransferase
MKREASAVVPLLAIERKAAKPLHRQIYDAFRFAILARRLHPGQRVPSTRVLAGEVGVSRMPVLNAYAQLLAEGYFESHIGSGTRVCSSLPDQAARSLTSTTSAQRFSGPRRFSLAVSRIAHEERAPRHGLGAFGVGQVAFDHFPVQIWSRLVTRHSRAMNLRSAHYGDPMGSRDLRETIAAYLRTARAVSCGPEQIMVVDGSQQALEITARVLLDRDSAVWMEDPGYSLMRDVLVLTGCRIVPVPVDDEGLNVAAGMKLSRRARAAFVTPSHQYPLGVTMSASRRLQLLQWAQTAGAWIIEDDYDSEYRYDSMPIASLQGLDRHARVIYIGTFSKVLYPSLRLGYMVVPHDLIQRFRAVRRVMDLGPPGFYQAVVADFIREGHFARHIRRMRTLYRERRSALCASLTKEFGEDIQIAGAEAGMHLALLLPDFLLSKWKSDVSAATHAAEQKLWLWPLSPGYMGKTVRQGFILGFGSTTVEEIPRAVRKMRNLLRPD